MQSEGQVRMHMGTITRYSEDQYQANVEYRGMKCQTKKTLPVDHVISCTGSETDCRRIDESFVTSLFVQGFARPDPLFLGLDVDEEGALIDYKGISSQMLYAIGPTRKGCPWETMTVPEIRMQAAAMGEYLADKLECISGHSRGALKSA
jgi:uncharacterized NAD(P)/FAD-binding protein YdhS